MPEYGVFVKGKKNPVTIEAKNLQQAIGKASRQYGSAKLEMIYRHSTGKGREYESHYFA